MRILILIALLGACKKELETKRVSALEFKNFTLPVPAGWELVTDQRLLQHAGPNSHTVMPVQKPAGFVPSIYIQELELDASGHQMLQTATVEACRDQVQAAVAAMTKTHPGPVTVATYGTFKGCDAEVIDPNSAQGARQLALSNGKLAASILCNRDKAGAPEVGAVCVGFARALASK